jgi:anti-sigma-K factor RskA
MSDLDDKDGLAAEYVLGTLDAAERSRVAAQRLRDSELDHAILAWERRLHPLNETVAPQMPSDTVFENILRRIDGSLLSDGKIIDLTRRLQRWRAAALTVGAVAAMLLIALGFQLLWQPSTPGNFVAVLQKDSLSPAFLVSVDLKTRTLSVRPVAATPQQGKSYELWLVSDKVGAPKSLGVIDNAGFTSGKALASYDNATVESATLAVSLEPEGGSKTGQVTGPVLFTGKLIAAAP